MVKIIINIDSLTKPPLTGIGYYTLNLLKEFIVSSEIKEVYCFYGTKLINAKDINFNKFVETAVPSDSKTIFLLEVRKLLRKIPYLYGIREKFKNLYFSALINKNKLSNAVYLEPNYIIQKSNNKTISVIHDLSHVYYPEYHPRERVKFLNKELPETIQKSDHIITVSNFVRNELINQLGVLPDRITTVFNGVGKQFKPYSKHKITSILSGYGLEYKKYILSVGTLEPRKNIHGVINAFVHLKDDLSASYPLVLAGASGWKNSKLKKIINNLVKQGKIYDVGYVPDDILPLIYSGASVFVYISHYEGFGLPVLEAMACGIPVITSKMTSMAEIAGDAALLVEQNDRKEISGAIELILKDEDLALKYSCLGLERAKKFSWEKAASDTIKAIQNISV